MADRKRQRPKEDAPNGLSVLVRVRQYIEREKQFVHKDLNYYTISPDNTSILLDGKQYTLDRILRPEMSQEEVFESTGKGVVDSCLKGYTATIMAYGQTGSGKTYTMTGGTGDSRGVLPRSLEYMFHCLESNNTSFTAQCSYLEIYNERVRDLLPLQEPSGDAKAQGRPNPAPRNRDPNNLTIVSQGTDDSMVMGLTQHQVKSSADALQLLSDGFANRTTASTKMNSESSRSHSVFTIYLAFQHPQTGQPRQCKLHFVDLAGSESAKKTGAEGQTLAEGNNINRSLSCLSKMIKTLADNYAKGRREQFSVRESKLTFLLRKSFGQGNPLCLIANISPSSDNVMETTSTLTFAKNARALPNTITMSQDVVDPYLVQQLQQQELQKHMSQAQSIPSTIVPKTDYELLLDLFGDEDALFAQLQSFHNVAVFWKRQRLQ